MIKKSILFGSLILLSFLTLIIATTYVETPNPGHGADEVYIYINGSETTLQNALNESLFENCEQTGGEYTSQIIKGHNAKEIIINVNRETKTLQQALNDSSLLSSDNFGNSPATYSDTLFQYQTANQIKVKNLTDELTLQDAINQGWFECESETPEEPTGECRYTQINTRITNEKSDCPNCTVCIEDWNPSYGGTSRFRLAFIWDGQSSDPTGYSWICEAFLDKDHNCDYFISQKIPTKEVIVNGYIYTIGTRKETYRDGVSSGIEIVSYEVCREPTSLSDNFGTLCPPIGW